MIIDIPKNISCSDCLSGMPSIRAKSIHRISIKKIPSINFKRYYCKNCRQTGIMPIPLSEIL